MIARTDSRVVHVVGVLREALRGKSVAEEIVVAALLELGGRIGAAAQLRFEDLHDSLRESFLAHLPQSRSVVRGGEPR